jgi:hypothetical protein
MSCDNESKKAEVSRSPEVTRKGSVARLFSRSNSVAPVEPPRRMLTCGQISDLFRRLDKDGNGALDLEEFLQIIAKLKINASEEFIAK